MAGPSFTFRLERVRALRERREDAAKQALAGAMFERERSEHELRQASQSAESARQAQLDVATTPTSATELMAHQAFLERSELAVRARKEDLRRQEQALATRRDELTEAARDRQALERLKEHRRSDHAREQARVDALDLDEIALNGFRRRVA